MSEKLKFTLKAWVVITVTTLALSALTEGFFKYILGMELPEQNQVEVVRQLIKARAWKLLLINGGLVLAAMPCLEECIFRWVTRFGWSRPKVWWFLAILFAALFAAAHYTQPGSHFPDNAFLALFAFALLQSALYRRTRALWCAMLTHALFNLTNVVLLLVMIFLDK